MKSEENITKQIPYIRWVLSRRLCSKNTSSKFSFDPSSKAQEHNPILNVFYYYEKNYCKFEHLFINLEGIFLMIIHFLRFIRAFESFPFEIKLFHIIPWSMIESQTWLYSSLFTDIISALHLLGLFVVSLSAFKLYPAVSRSPTEYHSRTKIGPRYRTTSQEYKLTFFFICIWKCYCEFQVLYFMWPILKRHLCPCSNGTSISIAIEIKLATTAEIKKGRKSFNNNYLTITYGNMILFISAQEAKACVWLKNCPLTCYYMIIY